MRTTLAAVAALMIAASPLAAQTHSSAPAIRFVDKQNNSEVLGTDFIGTPVITKGGDQVGKISNLVFDENGRIELAVIGIGGVLGIGEKEVAVPFDAIKSEEVNGKHVFAVDATKEELKDAPTYQTLSGIAFNKRMAVWREKAAQSWADIKSRATKAYEEAKTRIEESRQKPSQQQ